MKNFAGEELYSVVSNGTCTFFLSDDDVIHITKVMRHQNGDFIYVTEGDGKFTKF